MNKSLQWWNEPEDKKHTALMARVRSVEESQKAIAESNLRLARLYGNCDLAGLTYTSRRTYDRRPGPTVQENVIRSSIDTVCAKISRNQTRVTFQTDGGDWGLQRRAQLLEKFVEAEFHRTDFYRKSRMVFRDACVFGLGVLKVCDDGGKISCERILPDDIIVDDAACRNAKPREIYERRFVDRDVALALAEEWLDGDRLEEAKQAIEHAHGNPQDRLWTSWRRLEDHQIALIEGYRLPTRPGKGDGRRIVAIEGFTLVDEPWEEDESPYLFLWYSPPLAGFYGEGAAHILSGRQIRINQQLRVIEMSQNRVAIPFFVVGKADQHLQGKFVPEVGRIMVTNTGQPPSVVTPPGAHPEWYDDLERNRQKAYQDLGVSELSVSSKKPGGIESAAGLREYKDSESDRFSIQEIDLEDLGLRAGVRYVKLGSQIYKGTDYSTMWRAGSIVKKVPWKDVDPEELEYVVSVQAASLLSRTPAGRKSDVVEFMQAGFLSRDQALRLWDHPDLGHEISLMTASLEYAEMWCERILDGGEYLPPEPYENLDLGLTRRTQVYLDARIRGAPEDILENFRAWITQAEDMKAKATAALQMGAQPPGPPQSAMLPGQEAMQ